MKKVAVNNFLLAKNVPRRRKNKLFEKPLINKGFLFIPFRSDSKAGSEKRNEPSTRVDGVVSSE